MLSKFIYPPILTGILAGLIISIISIFFLYPIIYEAELLEITPSLQLDNHEHVHEHNTNASHEHIENQTEFKHFQKRNFITLMVNIAVITGYAFIIMGLTNLLKITINLRNSIFIGLVGFLCFYLLPSIALTPQLPGAQYTESLYYRQLIWLSIACSSLVGFIIIYLNTSKFIKLIGIALVFFPLALILIFNSNIPMDITGGLHYKFIYYTFLSNLIMWLTIAVIFNFINSKSGLSD